MTTAGGMGRRRFLRAVGTGALGLGGLLGACGALQPAAPTATPLAETTITIWNWIDEALTGLLQNFEQANPGIRVRAERYSYDRAHRQLLSALESGSGAPDVFITDLDSLGGLRGRPGLADLGGPPFDGARLRGDILPQLWDHVAFEGRVVALPWNVGVGVAWYRADVLQAAGLPVEPETLREQARGWDGWLALDEALRRKSQQATLVAESLPLFPVAVEQRGHGWVERGRLLVEEKGVPAAELVAALHERDVPPELAGGAFARRMVEGEIAGMVNGSWMQFFLQRDFQATAGKWRLARAPGGDFLSGALFLLIPQQSQHQEAAWAFLRHMCASPEGQNTTFAATGALPAYRPAWNDPLYDRPVEFFGGQPAYRLLTQAAAELPAGTLSPFDQQIDRIVRQQAERVARGDKGPDEAMADAAAEVRKQIPELAKSLSE
ncbi:MAG TPA: extracellular solute-binding protein [Roseiflexaceae bacterium]|nr:extracellular solute-binding protein [Roseiflexaceae bacterium]